MTVTTRPALAEDLPEIQRIYNDAILNTTATFNTEALSLDTWRDTLATQTDAYPLLVALVDGRLAGWGLIRPYGQRQAYRYTVENAVYVDPASQGRGVGSELLKELIRLAAQNGYHAVLALIVAGNEASVHLHEKFGFERVGLMREVGWKFDRWLDLVVMERLL